MTLEEWSHPLRALLEAELDRLLPAPDVRPERLHQAMRYSALAPGKRIRPLLCFAAAEACGAPPERVLPTACALECIHAFSLIHDDLPALDNDDLRRGQPTCHRAFDEATAILAGDALFAFAFDLAARNRATAPDAAVLRVLALLAWAAGTSGMVGGQAVDIESETREPTPETVDYIHENKTGALIRASVLSGGILALSSPPHPPPNPLPSREGESESPSTLGGGGLGWGGASPAAGSDAERPPHPPPNPLPSREGEAEKPPPPLAGEGWGGGSAEADKRIAALAEYGSAVGKAFQIADDVLNATADAETLGKPVGSDAALHKTTYVALYGVERSRTIANKLASEALAAVAPFGDSADALRLLCRYATDRDR